LQLIEGDGRAYNFRIADFHDESLSTGQML